MTDLKWRYQFVFTFDNGKTASIEGDRPHPQMFDVWKHGDTLGKVVSIERINITPAGTVYDKQTYTQRPPSLLNLNADGEPVCPCCAAVSNKFYATFPDLKCYACGKSMYPEAVK